MAKNYRTQHRPKHQTQTPSMSPSYAYILDDAGSNSTPTFSYAMQTDDMDDDDICPVCESECTCANRSQNINVINSPSPSQSHGLQNGSVQPSAPIAHRAAEPSNQNACHAPSNNAGHPSLKIKLTLPPSLGKNATSSGNSKSLSANGNGNRIYKKKSKSHAETTYGGGTAGGDVTSSSPFSAPGQPLLPGSGPIPKKRGRPTKAVVAAREAAARSALEAGTLDGGAMRAVSHADVARRKLSAKSKSGSALQAQQKRGKKLHGAAAASRAKAQQRRQTHPTSKKVSKPIAPADVYRESSSELSDLQDEDDATDAGGSIQFPTFVSAFSSSSNSSSSESESSDSEVSDIVNEKVNDLPIPRDDTDQQQRKWSHTHRNNWEIRPRKKSVGADGSSDAGMVADSDEESEEEEEEADEADEDADGNDQDGQEDEVGPGVRRLMRYAGVATGWTDDDDDDSFDADLFFANLDDSSESGSNSDDDQMGDAEFGFGEGDAEDAEDEDGMELGASGFESITLSEAAAGFLQPFSDLERTAFEHMPFSLSWDTQFPLSSDLKDDGNLFGFDSNVAPMTREDIFNTLQSNGAFDIPGLEDADTMMATSEEEEAVAMFDLEDSQDADEEGVEIFEDSDDGETTEDEFVDVDGVATPRNLVLLRFPASLGAIDPMSTVSSPVFRGRTLTTSSAPITDMKGASEKSHQKPTDILAGKMSPKNKKDTHKSVFGKDSLRVPTMGSFAPELTDKSKRIVITSPGSTAGGEIPPSPFPAIFRIRRGSDSLSKLSRSGSDRGSGGSRPSSLLASTRSPYQSLIAGDFDSPVEDLPPAEPIRLDDVLDVAFLEPEASTNQPPDSVTSETGESDSEVQKHLENLRRWDRIPMDTFRKTRAAGAQVELGLSGKIVATGPGRRAPRPADGFSYGSAAGGMLRGSPLSATLWDSDSAITRSELPKRGGRSGLGRSGRTMSVIISPVILPVRDRDRDGDRTPTNDKHSYQGYSNQYAHAQNAKSRKELRKEKRQNRKFFGSPKQGINARRQHFPNSKSRSSGAHQRAHFFSSSVPPLSI